VSWKAITGSSHAPLAASACQNGVERLEAMVDHARPSRPETGELSSPLETPSQTPSTWFATEKPAICTVSCPKKPTACPEP
jgi:hypothetical protein